MNIRITKFVHSCVIVESESRTVLFDPGVFSWESGIDFDALPSIDRLAITHEHQDHLYLPFVEEIIKKNPSIQIIANRTVLKLLEQYKLKVKMRESSNCLQPFKADHEETPWIPGVENNGFHFMDTFTHPGDSHSLAETKEILALPITAPWGSLTTALKLAIRLKPKIVIPIHDWHLNPDARAWYYRICQEYLNYEKIKFLCIKDGDPIDL